MNQLSRIGEYVSLQDGGRASRTAVRRTLKDAPSQRLNTVDEIVDVALSDSILIGRTTFWNSDRSWRAVLEYPIGYINCLPRISAFTVDVGPILAPDFDELRPSSPLACLRPAFILYKTLQQIEIVYRVATPIGHTGAKTLHYSKVVHRPAECEIFRLL